METVDFADYFNEQTYHMIPKHLKLTKQYICAISMVFKYLCALFCHTL